MFNNLLVPFDGSKASSKALDVAFDFGKGCDPIDLTVLHVHELHKAERTSFDVAAVLAGLTSFQEDKGGTAISEHDEHAQKRVNEFFENIPENINFSISVEQGDASDIICQYADQRDFDCIVMGSRGMGAFQGALGSVSKAVLRDTSIPVLIVR